MMPINYDVEYSKLRMKYGKALQRIEELEAPVLPDDVAEMVKYWRQDCFAGDKETEATADLLERQAREIRKLKHRPSVATFNALQEECDGRMVAIKKLQAKIKELETPVLPDEIKDMQMWLNTKGTETALRIADLLERQARDIRVQEVFATSQRKLVAVQAERIEQLEDALRH